MRNSSKLVIPLSFCSLPQVLHFPFNFLFSSLFLLVKAPHSSCPKLEMLFYHFSYCFSVFLKNYLQMYVIIILTEKQYLSVYLSLTVLFHQGHCYLLCIHQDI